MFATIFHCLSSVHYFLLRLYFRCYFFLCCAEYEDEGSSSDDSDTDFDDIEFNANDFDANCQIIIKVAIITIQKVFGNRKSNIGASSMTCSKSTIQCF